MSGLELGIITFSETWRNASLSSKIVEIDGYKSFRQDREGNKRKVKRGGGLITYTHNELASNTEMLSEISSSTENIEAQWIHIYRPFCKDVLSCNMYRPPNGDLIKAISYLNDCLKNVNLEKMDVFLLGDMNVNYKNKTSPNFKKFNFFTPSNGLTQYISTTTRNTDKSSSLIDLALTNSKFVSSSGTLNHFVSDHQPIYIVHKKSRVTRSSAQFRICLG